MSASAVFGIPLVAMTRSLDFMGRHYEPGETIDLSTADPRRVQLLLRQNKIAYQTQVAPGMVATSQESDDTDDQAVNHAGSGLSGSSGYKPSRRSNR